MTSFPTLHTETVGTGAHQVAFLHGLMGRGKNFTTIAKALGSDYSVLLVDMPNHAGSPWTNHFSYRDMADTVAANLKEHFQGQAVDIIGHSMGGKTAMYLALRHPELVRRLVIIDIAPGPSKGNFDELLGALLAIDLKTISRRSQAQALLEEAIPHPATRGFFLQNLKVDSQGARWEPNIELLASSLDAIMGWEGLDPTQGEKPFTGPVLWIAGGDSPYIQPADSAPMRALFPKVHKVTLKGASHWVHADKPQEVTYLLDQFFSQKEEG